jgi:hypothetical protein
MTLTISDLDHRDGDRQHQGAEGFADAVGDHLGMVDRGDHGTDQRDRAGGHQQRAPRHRQQGGQEAGGCRRK